MAPLPTWIPRLSYRARAAMILAIDGAITATSFWLAMLLRFEFDLPANTKASLLANIGLLVACRVVVAAVFRLHRWSFRFSGLPDGARIAMAGLFGTCLFALGLYLLHLDLPGGTFERPPRSVIVMELLLTTTLMASLRFSPRLALMYRTDLKRARAEDAIRTVIVGAGAAGEMLLRDLQRSDHDLQVVGFVDDDRHKHGQIVGGRAVLGATEDLPRLAVRHKVAKVLIAIPGLSAGRVREILSYCSTLQLQFKILPLSFRYLDEKPATSVLQDLSPEDLLEREEVSLTHDGMAALVRERVQLVSGAAGSIGSEVCVQLLALGTRRLVMVDIDENGLYMLHRRLERQHPEATIWAEVGDIRDRPRIHALFSRYRPHDVFHAAARKHVPLMESAPCEAVKTNVMGTMILAEAAEASGAERFVFMSTDKAVRPTSVMGASKRLGELLLQRLASRGAVSATKFCVVRFGNVLGSAGSVVPLFRAQIAAGGPVTVTHPEMRRFFMTISEAVGLVLRAGYGDYGPLCVLDMGEQIRILDLARHMITMSGRVPDIDVRIEITGLRPGEKLYEELLCDGEREVARADRKIRLVTGPALPSNLEVGLEQLRQAIAAEDDEAVMSWLHQVVPQYRSLASDGILDPLSDGSGVLSLDLTADDASVM